MLFDVSQIPGRAVWRLRLFTSLCALCALIACGGNTTPSANTSMPALVAPSSLTYDSPRPLYMSGDAITNNAARVFGGPVSSFSVSPALPAGLGLDAQSGLISGTPTELQRETEHTVTASNAAGSAQAVLRLTVTGRGSWTDTSAHTTSRHSSALTVLADGRVLAAGGFAAGGSSSATEIYEPLAGRWIPAAPMLYPSSGHRSVRLLDGRVLTLGGDVAGSATTARAELYDPGPAADWTATGSMAVERSNATATRLADGSVLAVGGYAQNPLTFTDTVERYDPSTGHWTTLATRLSTPRAQHAAELLPGGTHLLVVGGVNHFGFVRSAELYAVDGSGTTPIAFTDTGNVFLSAVLDDGSVLVVCDGSTTAWRYLPDSGTWQTSTFSITRSIPTLTALADGRVLLAGGAGGGNVRFNSAEIYNPDHNLWTAASPMTGRRNGAAAALLGDGDVLMFSGFDGTGEVAGSERFRP